MKIEFTVYGEAKPAGSKQSFPIVDKATGNVRRSATGRIMTAVKHANPKTKDWMALVGQVAADAYDGELLDGPIALTLTFYRVRPVSHYGTGRNAGKLKDSAPEYPTTRPDTVKLTRAVEDALTKIIWVDDSQVVSHFLTKRWGKQLCVEVTIGYASHCVHEEERERRGG